MNPTNNPKLANDFTILVLEDEHPLLQAIKIKMENLGLNSVTARTVSQALSYLEELQSVDAIWLDHYLLGKESGLDFVAQIKKDESVWKNIPIFVVSNTASDDKINSYFHFGVKNYYVKTNYRLDQIITDIKNYLRSEGESL
jgi:CheY-like chemotaxis protein